MNIETLNNLPDKELYAELEKCCGSSNWIVGMMNQRPFDSREDLIQKADACWDRCSKDDGLEAFEHHPKIGDKKNLEKKFASTKEWAGNEQSGVDHATADVIDRLAQGNTDYEEKFGYIFIVCATGKSAEEMLDLLTDRIKNEEDKEIEIAMGEQHKITKLRIAKLLG